MSNVSLNVHYRPLRIGFCVDSDNIKILEEVAELNTLLCGGMCNPIIPVGDFEYAKSLVVLFKVDILYPVSDSEDVKNFIKSQSHLKSFDLEEKFLWSTDQGWADSRGNAELRVLDVMFALEQYSSNLGEKFLNVKWNDEDPFSVLYSLSYGRFPQRNENYNIPKYFKSLFYNLPLRINSSIPVDLALVDKPLPIHISTLETNMLGSYFGWNNSGIYVGDHDNFEDLVTFWNLRATGLDIIFVPISSTVLYKFAAQAHINRVYKVDSKNKFPNGIATWSRHEISEEIINVVLNNLEVSNEVVNHRCRVGEHSWNGLNIRPVELVIKSRTIIADLENKYGRPRITFQLQDVPVVKNRDLQPRQHFCVSIDPLSEHEYDGYTLKLPFIPDLNDWYGRQISYGLEGLRVENDGFAMIIDTHDSIKTVSAIRHDLLIKRLFERAGIKADDSQAGWLTRKLIEQMDGLEGCRVFKIKGVRKLINSLNSSDYTTQSEAMRIILDEDKVSKKNSFKNHESLYIAQRDEGRLNTKQVFNFMLNKKMFRAGLELICTNCRLKSWLSISELDDEVVCEHCGALIELNKQLKDRGDWKFRKSGLIRNDNNQEGAIPVVLTLLQLLHLNHREFVYTPALKLDSSTNNINCETDFASLGKINDFRGEDKVTVAIGEIKSNSGEITNEDISNLLKVKEALNKSGIRVYIIFAKTSDFTTDEILRFKDMVKVGTIPILLTDKELEPFYIYEYYRINDIKLPKKYASSLEDLARNSMDIYLTHKTETKEDPPTLNIDSTNQQPSR